MGKPRFELESNASKAPMLTPTPFPQIFHVIIIFSNLCRENRTPTPGSTAPCTTIILYRVLILIIFIVFTVEHHLFSINLEEYILWSYFNGFNGGKNMVF